MPGSNNERAFGDARLTNLGYRLRHGNRGGIVDADVYVPDGEGGDIILVLLHDGPHSKVSKRNRDGEEVPLSFDEAIAAASVLVDDLGGGAGSFTFGKLGCVPETGGDVESYRCDKGISRYRLLLD